MAAFTVDITGTARDDLAQELMDQLTAQHGQVQVFAETERVLDPVTIVSVVLSGLQAADILWHWWQSRRQRGSTVTIRTAGGRAITLADIDHEQLTLVLAEDEE